MRDPALAYNGLSLDRAAGRRSDPAWLGGVRAHPGSRAVLLWQDRCLVGPAGPLMVPVADLADEPVLLGIDGDAGVFAADLSTLDETVAVATAGAVGAVDVRRLVAAIDPHTAALLAYARGILYWDRNQRFCGTCGGPTESRDGGNLRACPGCARLLFPRIEPAVIALVQAPGPPARCLLGRHRGAAEGAYSTLAGFVELGESLEDAVRREVAEEAGVRVGDVVYQASRTWPFPAGLMIGFRATARSEDIDVDRDSSSTPAGSPSTRWPPCRPPTGRQASTASTRSSSSCSSPGSTRTNSAPRRLRSGRLRCCDRARGDVLLA